MDSIQEKDMFRVKCPNCHRWLLADPEQVRPFSSPAGWFECPVCLHLWQGLCANGGDCEFPGHHGEHKKHNIEKAWYDAKYKVD